MTEKPEKATHGLERELGLATAVGIVVSQMVGTGIFMTPQGMAELSNPKMAILATLITGTGTIFLAICFARLGENIPYTGSAVVYAKAAFGDFVGFLVGWAYWSGCWLANGAIIIGGVSYLSYFFPWLASNGLMRFLLTAGIVWFYTLLNILGVKEAGLFNLLITVLKFLPIGIFFVIAAKNFDITHFATASSPTVEGWQALPRGMAYMLWAFIGFEGITMNGSEAKNAQVIKKATLIGTIGVVVLYMALLIVANGSMSQIALAQSSSPFADIIQNATGWYWAGGFIAFGVFVSATGCIGAWILSSARVLYAMSEQQLFPKVFARTHPKYHTPHIALLVNAVLITLVLLLNFVAPQSTLYNFLILLAVSTFLVFYAFGAGAYIMLMAKKEVPFTLGNFIKNSSLGLIALGYALYTIYGSGAEGVMYGFLLLMAAIPFYIYFKFQYNEEEELRRKIGL